VRDWEQMPVTQVLYRLELNTFVYESNMAEDEKKDNLNFFVLGGYLKTVTMHEAWSNLWMSLNDIEKQLFKDLPNFDAEKFKTITGITIS
jgi:hypothetical protein